MSWISCGYRAFLKELGSRPASRATMPWLTLLSAGTLTGQPVFSRSNASRKTDSVFVIADGLDCGIQASDLGAQALMLWRARISTRHFPLEKGAKLDQGL